MFYHDDGDGRNGRVVTLLPSSRTERLLDLPEIGEVWIEFGPRGWMVHHADHDHDHASIVANLLPGRIAAIQAALLYAAHHIAQPKGVSA
jgi:hypothetical protein